MYLDTAASETSKPSILSSPWIRGAPHNGFSRDIRRISPRNSLDTGGRPGFPRRDFRVQKRRKPFRCQPITVSGLTITRISLQPRLKANAILQRNIAHLLTRPVGRPPDHVRRFHASFSYQAGSWNKKRRVVAKVEWHPGELVPRVGFIVTNLSRPTKRVVAFYNHRGTAEQHIKEGKNAINWTRLSCRKFRNNAVRLQLHALAYNLGNFMRTLALPKEVEHWSMTTLRDKLVKIGAKVVRHGRYVTFQLAEVAVPRDLFRKILSLIDDLRRRPAPA